MPIASNLSKFMSPRTQIGLGASFFIICLVLCSLVPRNMFTTFYMLYTLGYAIMLAGTYMVPVQLGWKTNPEWRGLILGVIIGGFGLGPLVFNTVSSNIVNPNNASEVLISK